MDDVIETSEGASRMSIPCHHHAISRLKAEQLLLHAGKDGSYLIRNSETSHGAYILCLLFENRVYQYKILPDSEKRLFVRGEKYVQERKFVDLYQLVHEYVRRGETNGLACALLHPVHSETQAEDRDSEEDEEDETSLTRPPVVAREDNNGNHDNTEETISKFMFQRFSSLDLSSQDGAFVNDLRNYAEHGVHQDISTVTSGGDKLNKLRKLLAAATVNLEKQMEIFMGKVEMCRQLFGQTTTDALKPRDNKAQDLDSLLEYMSQCRSTVQNFETKAVKFLADLKTSSDSNEFRVPSQAPVVPLKSTSVTIIPPTSFQVRQVKHGKQGSKMCLTVDLQNGKLLAVKPSREVLDSSNVFTHDRIEQLVKSTCNNCKLEMKVEGRKKDTFVFDNVWQREHFCQLVQQLIHRHSHSPDIDHISVFIGSWNMGSDTPSVNLSLWLKSQGVGKVRGMALGLIPHDLYVIGTQESALNEKDWVNRIKLALQETLAQDMHQVAVVSLWSIRIVILVRTDYKNKISHVMTDSVKTGIANALGNKGAVGVSFEFNGTALCFVNCHLTSGHERNARRNQNVQDIISGLHLGHKCLEPFDITHRFHHLFFLGDLNYRMDDDIDPLEIIRRVKKERQSAEANFSSLLEHDQLRRTQAKMEALFGFCEEEITFPPTYRIEKGTLDRYDWQKMKKTGMRINAPSWCDRVLWRSYPETYIKNTSYGSVEEIVTSDHKPVFATFDVGIDSQFVSSEATTANSDNVQIIFEELKAEIKTSTKQQFLVEFVSRCLPESASSKANTLLSSQTKPMFCSPKWSANLLPILVPLFDDRNYLEDQHILICVKNSDSMESYGECVLSLKSMFSVKPEPFECFLMHEGEYTGKLSGKMYVKTKGLISRSTRSRKSYELVYMDTNTLDQSQPILSPTASASCPELWSGLSTIVSAGSPGLPTITQEELLDTSDIVPVTCTPPMTDHNVVSKSTSMDSFIRRRRSPSPRHSNSRRSQPIGRQELEDAASDRSNNNSPVHIAIGGTDRKPVPPTRKPRMGQSSLSPTPVLPVTSSSASQPSRYDVHNNNNARCEDNATSTINLMRDTSRRQGVCQDNFRSLPIYRDDIYHNETSGAGILQGNPTNKRDSQENILDKRDSQGNTADKRDSQGNTASLGHSWEKADVHPPPLPRKRRVDEVNTPEYESLRRPATVNEWLLNIGLPQYIPTFFEQGWDQVNFIHDLSAEDLQIMNIHDVEHQQRLLKSIVEMR